MINAAKLQLFSVTLFLICYIIFFICFNYISELQIYRFPVTVSISYSYIFLKGRVSNVDNSEDFSGSLITADCKSGFAQVPFAGFRPFPFKGTYDRRRRVPPIFDLITAFWSLPFFQVISTVNPPRACKPFTSPSAQSSGSAGNR